MLGPVSPMQIDVFVYSRDTAETEAVAAERAIASAARSRISRRATSRASCGGGHVSLVALHKAWTKLRRDNSTLTATHH